ncbi:MULTISPECIES: DUF3307 domain-containing protein [Chryseobacterium]|uniref:DUF3307 domain-containing protein n=1 Tax=Chryseobacterium bernardetii TaxID=1241978 RepID=A0A3G6TEB7_9FLAO|nr:MULTISPECIES: DUF3307 domain-containing protein [Chryseobacterium]AZB26317.1 DUF3307 domain-containing protein [Chryseobacterium bernardetii]AZB32820.1 DUF3307 domain-containing protein [Chryseobacterium bernardetii]UCA60582.1 DUF3307 domain-containing protein [Chryseobacterium rhizoplanae]
MIFIKLILAHLLGDFILQPNSWVADKENYKLKSKFLYFHILIHTVLSFIFLWDLQLWWVAVLVGITHFIIDAAKLNFQTIKTKKRWFFIDQLLHILVIAGASFYFGEFNFSFLQNQEFLKIMMAALFLTTPASIFIKLLLSSWTPAPDGPNTIQTESLSSAGKYIGILERLLVFTFIMVNHWEGVGFMVAAKSVFRFSDLAQAKQRKLTEYVLIGTLLSFGLAVLTGIIIK